MGQCGATAAGRRERRQRGTQSCNVGLTIVVALNLALAGIQLLLCRPKELRACRQPGLTHTHGRAGVGKAEIVLIHGSGC